MRNLDDILGCATELIRILSCQGCDLVILACNTAYATGPAPDAGELVAHKQPSFFGGGLCGNDLSAN